MSCKGNDHAVMLAGDLQHTPACSVTQLCATLAIPWSAAHQAPLSMGFPRQEYWRRLPFPSPGDLPDSGIELASPALAGGVFTTEPSGKPCVSHMDHEIIIT